ncbi:MAG: PD-(D/E)XK nuclease domain-containing protein, partial [bacterium]|nr:PD-(D/E)XK nuclease domain-containing protein [Candidatus Colisoma equi]
ANAAVRQIREKGYADAYRGDKRPVTLVGVNFRTAKRNIDEPVFWSEEGRGESGERGAKR